MVNKLLKSITATDSVGSLRPVIDWKDDLNRSLTVVNVVTWDRAGLFYKLAGAFSVAGLNILGAKVISRTDHIAIDTFYVVEPGRGVVQNSAAQESFAKIIESSLMSNADLYPDILAQAKKIAATRYLYAKGGETLHSSFPPTVDVYHEISMQRTIVEVQARDQIGLLYRLAKAISDFGFDITFARIGTERGVAIDTFYIESANHEPVEDPERLQKLRSALAEVITPAPVAGRRGRASCGRPRNPLHAPPAPARLVAMTEDAELRALHAMSSLASGTDDPGAATREILSIASAAFAADSGIVAFQNPETGRLEIEAAVGLPADADRSFAPGQGIPGWVAWHGRPALAPTPRPTARAGRSAAETRCEMAAPMLLADGHVLGVLALSRDAAGAYTPGDLDGLVRLADVAARVLRRLWDLRHLREKARQLETLIATGQALVGKLEQRQLFDTLSRDATAMMQAKACALYLLDPGAGALRLASYSGAAGTLAPEGACRFASASRPSRTTKPSRSSRV